MKIQPLAAGTGVPAASDSSLGRTADPAKLARAKAIASGAEPTEQAPQTGDAQVDRINARRIKMKTQVSTNRHEMPAPETSTSEESDVQPVEQNMAISDVNEPAQEQEETRPLSPQFAALAKAKRAIQVKEMELAKREEALKNAQPSMEDYISKADLIANPLKVFEAGVSYEQLTDAILSNQSQPVDPRKLREEIKAELLAELEGKFTSRDEAAEQQVLGEYRKEANSLVLNNPDKYEAIIKAKGQDYVVDLIHRTWKETGEVMDIEEAADLVESQLIDEALPFAQLKKVQSRLTPAQEEAMAEQIPAMPKPNTRVMKTLTNRDNATPTQDRRSRALAAWNNALKRG